MEEETRYTYISVFEDGSWITFEKFLASKVTFEGCVLTIEALFQITGGWLKIQAERYTLIRIMESRRLDKVEEARYKYLTKLKGIRIQYNRLFGVNGTRSRRHHIYYEIGGETLTYVQLKKIPVRFNGEEITLYELIQITGRIKKTLCRVRELRIAKKREDLKKHEQDELASLERLIEIRERYKAKRGQTN